MQVAGRSFVAEIETGQADSEAEVRESQTLLLNCPGRVRPIPGQACREGGPRYTWAVSRRCKLEPRQRLLPLLWRRKRGPWPAYRLLAESRRHSITAQWKRAEVVGGPEAESWSGPIAGLARGAGALGPRRGLSARRVAQRGGQTWLFQRARIIYPWQRNRAPR